jgi:hypothetical protein
MIDEHEMRPTHAAYARLRSDPPAWQDYQAELAEWDHTTSHGLDNARDEFPDFN